MFFMIQYLEIHEKKHNETFSYFLKKVTSFDVVRGIHLRFCTFWQRFFPSKCFEKLLTRFLIMSLVSKMFSSIRRIQRTLIQCFLFLLRSLLPLCWRDSFFTKNPCVGDFLKTPVLEEIVFFGKFPYKLYM